MRSRHCAAECRLDRWSSCIRSMSDLGQSAVLTVRRPLPAFPHKQTFSGSVSQWCQERKSAVFIVTPCPRESGANHVSRSFVMTNSKVAAAG
jgi:hypothetical protein